MAERALEAMKSRVKERVAFGKLLAEQDTIVTSIAQSRMEIEQARWVSYTYLSDMKFLLWCSCNTVI